jgi:hypothetical protein
VIELSHSGSTVNRGPNVGLQRTERAAHFAMDPQHFVSRSAAEAGRSAVRVA